MFSGRACWRFPALQAQEQVIDREYEIKAAYLYNFGLYVQWPNSPAQGTDENIAIGVLGKDPFGPHLDRIAEAKTIEGKKIVVYRFKSMDQYRPCHILYVAARTVEGEKEERPEDRLAAVLRKTRGAPVLLVGDTEGFAQKGVMINFYIEENRVKFEMNPDAAKRAGLQISSKLLKLGKIVPSN